MHHKVVPIANHYAYLTSCYLAFNSVRCSAYKHDVQQSRRSNNETTTGPPLNVEYVEQIFSIDAQPRALGIDKRQNGSQNFIHEP
jgi:CBS-domain-containing membrane protein